MTHDPLRAASRALREETERPDHDGSETRARLMASLHQTRVRKRTRLAFVLPLAASFVAATALGRLDQRLPQLVRSVAHSLGLSAGAPAASDSTPQGRAGKSAASKNTASKNTVGKSSATKVSAPQAPIEQTPAPSELAPGAAAPSEPAPGEPASLPSSPSPAQPEPVASPPRLNTNPSPSSMHAVPRAASSARRDDGLTRELELYRAAHSVHFEQHDYARALESWDNYLRAMPNGRFAPEARYNRGVCLLRLGREVEAQQALAPFAAGQYGDYRRHEAQTVLEALQR